MSEPSVIVISQTRQPVHFHSRFIFKAVHCQGRSRGGQATGEGGNMPVNLAPLTARRLLAARLTVYRGGKCTDGGCQQAGRSERPSGAEHVHLSVGDQLYRWTMVPPPDPGCSFIAISALPFQAQLRRRRCQGKGISTPV